MTRDDLRGSDAALPVTMTPWRASFGGGGPDAALPPRVRARVAIRTMGPFARVWAGRPGISLRLVLVRGWDTEEMAGFLLTRVGGDGVGRLYDPLGRDGGMRHLREALRSQYVADPVAYIRVALGHVAGSEAMAAELMADMDEVDLADVEWFTRDLVADVDQLFARARPRMRAYAALRVRDHTLTEAAHLMGVKPTSLSRYEARYREALRGYLHQP
jgi:hypothetical protein